MDPLAVGEHGAPRLPVSGVLQGAAIVLPAIVNEGNDTRGSAGSARDSCAFLGTRIVTYPMQKLWGANRYT